MKKGLLIVAAVLMLAGAVNAGEIKIHQWPCAFVAQNFMTIPVKMDIGYWIRVKNQGGISIKLAQETPAFHSYKGCTTFNVESNFTAILTASIAQSPNIPDGTSVGNLSVDFGVDGQVEKTVTAGTTSVTVCAHLTNANLAISTANTTIQVAIVTIKVVPQA